jgi:HlyD family secretion protein
VAATEVQVAPDVGGRILEMRAQEGDRVNAGDVIATLDTRDAELTLRRARAERAQAEAQLRLLLAGSRTEDIKQAEAQASAAGADVATAQAEAASAAADAERFERLLQSRSGSQKQRDDAATRLAVAQTRLAAARAREVAAAEAAARFRAGPRPEEAAAARARVASADAQISSVEKLLQDTTVRTPVSGIVSERLLEAGEMAAPGSPLIVVMDLDRTWAEVFVDEPQVPRLRLATAATVHTDAGQALPGTVSFISPRAEFTPRNVQTADDRSKLVYRVKIAVDNRQGILKQGMPVEAEIPLQ